MTGISDDVVEAVASLLDERIGLSMVASQDIARACLTAAIRQWNAKGVVVAEVPEEQPIPERPGRWWVTERELDDDCRRDGHNAVIAQIRANQITGGDDEG